MRVLMADYPAQHEKSTARVDTSQDNSVCFTMGNPYHQAAVSISNTDAIAQIVEQLTEWLDRTNLLPVEGENDE